MSESIHGQRVDFGKKGSAYYAIDENGETHAYIGSIGDELAQRGIIFQRDNLWHIKKADADIVEREYRFLAVCDFCSRRPVTWNVECETFTEDTMPGPPATSEGDWAACEACGTLIKNNDRAGLLTRTIAHATLPEMARLVHPVFQNLFWKHYKGRITRIGVGTFGH